MRVIVMISDILILQAVRVADAITESNVKVLMSIVVV